MATQQRGERDGPVGGPPAVGAPPADRTPPHGATLALDRHVVSLDGGAALLGGAPPRLVRLAPAARALLAPGRFTVTDTTSATLGRRLLDAGIVHPVPGAGPGPEDVTVVIPVKDRAAAVARLLAALPPDLGGVIVVDDGSADPAALRTGAAGRARVLRHDRAQGPAAARNAGLAAATTPLVAFLDSDVLPEPGWLAPLLGHLADPAVGLVAPRIVALPWTDGWLARYEAVRSSLDLGPDPAAIVPRSRVAYVPSAALLVRRAAVGAGPPSTGSSSLGPRRTGFDERMHVAEDVDLVLRLHAVGWRLRYEPASRVAHEHRTGLRTWWLRKAYYGSGAAPLALRHPGAVPPLVLTPWSAAVVALVLSRHPAVALAVAAAAAERLARQLPGASRATAVRIITLGAVGAVAQTADGITRHFWPLTALACVASRRARRVVAVVAVVEGLVDWHRHRRWDGRVRPGPLGHLVAHRLDDLAYGAGLWWGALRHRTLAPLRPTGPRFVPMVSGQPGPDDEGEGSTMTGPEVTGSGSDMPDAAGMPPLDPPDGAPTGGPDSPDPTDLVPGRPGPPPENDPGTDAS